MIVVWGDPPKKPERFRVQDFQKKKLLRKGQFFFAFLKKFGWLGPGGPENEQMSISKWGIFPTIYYLNWFEYIKGIKKLGLSTGHRKIDRKEMRLVWLGSVRKYCKAILTQVFHMSKCDGIHHIFGDASLRRYLPWRNLETQKPGLLTVLVYV